MGSFLGEFARSLQTGINKNLDSARALEQQKQLMELQKKYDSELIDSQQTRVVEDGGEFYEVTFGKRGNQLGRRKLTPSEAAARTAADDKAKAEARRATADATRSEFEADVADDRFALDKDESAARRAASQASVAQGWASVGQGNERLALERDDRAQRRISEVQPLVDQATQAIIIANADPKLAQNSSAKGELDQARREMNEAMARGDLQTARNIANEVLGEYGMEVLRQRTAASTPPLIPTQPGLDGDDSGFRLPRLGD
jgi:hypothetical protein